MLVVNKYALVKTAVTLLVFLLGSGFLFAANLLLSPAMAAPTELFSRSTSKGPAIIKPWKFSTALALLLIWLLVFMMFKSFLMVALPPDHQLP